MNQVSVFGILLIVAALLVFSYPYFVYRENQNVAKIGDVQVSMTHDKAVAIPPMVGGGLLAAGIVLLVLGATRK